MTFLADARRVTVTPEAGLPMAGFSARTAAASDALDDLEANLLLVRDETGASTVLVCLDSIAVTDALRDTLVPAISAASGVACDDVRVVATHTHSAPVGWVGEIHPVLPGEVDNEEIRRLGTIIGQAAGELDARAMELTWSVGEVDGMGANRHHPDGPHDRSTGVLTLTDDTGVVAILSDYACHPTILGPENLRYSADWVGAARRRVRESLGDIPILVLPGCAGDVSTRFTRVDNSPDELMRTGGLLAAEILERVGRGAKLHGPLVQRRAVIELPTRQEDPPEVVATAPASQRLSQSLHEGAAANQALMSRTLPASLAADVSWLAIGDARWLFMPVEPFASFGLSLTRRPDPIRAIGYADGYLGYMPDQAAYDAGHYEAQSAFVGAATARRFYEGCRSLCDLFTRMRTSGGDLPAD